MEKKMIHSISLPRMNNGAHFEYVSTIFASVQSLQKKDMDALILERVAAFSVAVAAEDEALKISAKSLITDDIAQADDERCALYVGYKKAVIGCRYMTDNNLATAAKVLNQHIKDYDIYVKAQIDKKTGLLANLIADLEGKYADHVVALGLTVFVTHMKLANERVRSLIRQRNNKKMGITTGALRTARANTDAAYHDLVDMVNALALVNGNAVYEAFIDYVNTEITRYKHEVLNQKAAATGTSVDNSLATDTNDSTLPSGDSGLARAEGRLHL